MNEAVLFTLILVGLIVGFAAFAGSDWFLRSAFLVTAAGALLVWTPDFSPAGSFFLGFAQGVLLRALLEMLDLVWLRFSRSPIDATSEVTTQENQQ